MVNLHTHSTYSIRDGLPTVKEMVDKTISLGQKALAITDHGNMLGWVDFYFYCLNLDFKPIFGCEFYFCDDLTRKDKGSHLILLAKNELGMRNLFRLIFDSYKYGFYYHPRIDFKMIVQHNLPGTVIASSACIGGVVGKPILDKNHKQVNQVLKKFTDAFDGDFYLEVQINEMKSQKVVTEYVFEQSDLFSIPVILTTDAHYLNAEDYAVHRDLLYMQSGGKSKKGAKMWEFDTKELFFKTEEQILQDAEKWQFGIGRSYLVKAMQETENLASKIEKFQIDTSAKLFVAKKYRHLTEEQRFEKFKNLCISGLKERSKHISGFDKEVYVARLSFEIQLIKDKGIFDYFLNIVDLLSYVRKTGIIVGAGRGSAAGSLVSYALGIVQINPIRFDLYFERFLNPHRKEMPDIDLDFSDSDAVKNLMVQLYNDKDENGALVNHNVGFVSGYSTFSFKSVFRDLCKLYDVKISEVNDLLKDLDRLYWEKYKEEKILDQGKLDHRKVIEASPKIKDFFQTLAGSAVAASLGKLSGKIRHIGKHASGVVVYNDLRSEMAMYLPTGNDLDAQTSATDGLNQRGVSALGHIKYDILDIKTLKMLDDCFIMMAEREGKDKTEFYKLFHPDVLNLEDPFVYQKIFHDDNLEKIFQFGERGIRDLIQKIVPECFDDIVAISAMYRPGPLSSGIVDTYGTNKRHPEAIRYLHPQLEPILKKTYNVLIYQEQVMEIVAQLGGLPLSDGDKVRKAMGKKEEKIMGEIKQTVLQGFAKNGIAEELAQKIWNMIYRFAGYGFNKAHAVSYTFLSYQCAYLKTYYPVFFYCAVLRHVEKDHYQALIKEARNFGVEVLRPDINQSKISFSAIDGKVIYGLSNVHGVGELSATEIVSHQPYCSVEDFLSKINGKRSITSRVVENLIESGCLDSLFTSRVNLMGGYYKFLENGSKISESSLFESSFSFARFVSEFEMNGIRIDPDAREKCEKMQSPLGVVDSEYLLLGNVFSNIFKMYYGAGEWKDMIRKYKIHPLNFNSKNEFRCFVFVRKISELQDKNGHTMAFARCITHDLHEMSVTIFNSAFEQFLLTNETRKDAVLQENGFAMFSAKLNYYNGRFNLIPVSGVAWFMGRLYAAGQ